MVEREKVKLNKNVGLLSGSALLIGSTIGAGIFITPRGVLIETRSVGLSLLVWGAAGVVALLGALSYTELGCLIKKSGCEYPFLLSGLGRIIAFMFAWTRIIVISPSILAATSLIFAEYVVTFFDYCGAPVTPLKLIAALVLVTLCILNCWDTKLVASVQVFFTASQLIAVAIIIIGGFVWLANGEVANIQTGFSDSSWSASSVALAFYDALWAYEGWKMLTSITEEIRDPLRTLPKANIIGVSLVTIVYVLTNASYLIVLGTSGVLRSNAIAVTWSKKVLGSASVIMPIFVSLASFGSANGVMFSETRIVYAAAREQQFPEVLSYVNIQRYTPIPSVIFTTTIALLMLIPADFSSLVDFFSFASWLFYALTMLSLFVLRRTMKDAERPIKVFFLIPLIFLMCSVYLVIAPIVQDPAIEFLYAFSFIIGGLVLYVPFVHLKADRGYFKPVTRFIQYWMQVVPSPFDPAESKK